MQPLSALRRADPPLTRKPERRDPAPSRAAYRFQRLWLTPFFRAFLRVGLPAFVIVMAAGAYFSDPIRRDAALSYVAQIRRDIEQRPEFMVKLMAVDGASPELTDDIREVLALDFPVSSFDLDLQEMRGQVAGLDAVQRVALRVRSGGILSVEVTERVPALVWRGQGGLELLDRSGHRVAAIEARSDRADLPLVAGEGADQAIPEALSLLDAAGPVLPRLRGLVRIGERRWDVVLNRGQRIMLPQEAPVAALQQVMALDQAQDLLGRDVIAVDMRNAHRPTVRLSDAAAEDMRHIKQLELEAMFR